MILYVVEFYASGEYPEDGHYSKIVGVFTTKENADIAGKHFRDNWDGYLDNRSYYIEEHELDKITLKP